MKKARLGIVLLLILSLAPLWAADTFDWKKYSGSEIHFLANNNPVGQLIEKYSAEFTRQTGIKVTVSLFAEQQFRQRLQTIMQARSDEVDVYMSLFSREGQLYDAAGWYQDLNPFLKNKAMTSPDYDFSDFGSGIANASVIGGRLTGVPNNMEGPILFYRTDILKELGLKPPKSLEELVAAIKVVKQKKPGMVPFASRGLAAAVPYTFSNWVHNYGGEFTDKAGKSALSSPAVLKALEEYATLLKDFGPPGVINYSFPQLTALQQNGQVVFTFQSGNEFANVMSVKQRTADTEVMPLPPGPGGSVPTVIGWQLSMSPHSRKQAQAWYFLQWATSKEMQIKFGVEGLASPRASVWKSAELASWLKEYPVRQQWADTLKIQSATGSSILAPQIILQPETRQIIGEAVGKVILGTANPAQAARDADKLIDALIEKSSKM